MSLSQIGSVVCETGFPANRDPDPDFFSLKPSWDQDKDNDICYSQIGSAVFELLSNIHTDIHTDRQTNILLLFIKGLLNNTIYFIK